MPQWLSGPELVVLVLVIVIVFGWKKLPDAARSLGRSMRIFKAEVEEMKDKPSAASRDTVHGEARHPQDDVVYRAADPDRPSEAGRDSAPERAQDDADDDVTRPASGSSTQAPPPAN